LVMAGDEGRRDAKWVFGHYDASKSGW